MPSQQRMSAAKALRRTLALAVAHLERLLPSLLYQLQRSSSSAFKAMCSALSPASFFIHMSSAPTRLLLLFFMIYLLHH